MSLLALRTTPIGNDLPTPAELLFGRKIGNNLPITTSGPSNDTLRAHRERCYSNMEQKSQRQYPELHLDQQVYFQDVAKKTWSPGTVVGIGPEPHSYTIEDEHTGKPLRRNRELVRPRAQVEFPTPESRPFVSEPLQRSSVTGSTDDNSSDDTPPPATPVPKPRAKPIAAPRSPIATRSRSGRASKPPVRLIESEDV